METLREILSNSEPLLLFLVIGLGYVVGQIKIRGFGLGIAGVLFVGLAFGAWRKEGADPLHISHAITEVGLILFVYAVGLTSGPGFFASLRQKGIRANVAILLALLAGGAIVLIAGHALGLPDGQIAGVFCGAITNTPALAAVTELVRKIDPVNVSDPTLGYSVAYPFGVIGALLAFQFFARKNNKALEAEREKAASAATGERRLLARNFKVTNKELIDRAIGELQVQDKTGVVISRLKHANKVFIPTKYTQLRSGDVLVAVGTKADLDKAIAYFGEESTERLEANHEDIELRRVLMSRRELVGKTIEELELDRRFNAQVTRIRRADIDMVAAMDTVLELGDRLRVVMPREKGAEVAEFFGDSERDVAELDYTAITLGISLGVLVGMIPIPAPGGANLALGFAGGPLLVALILGKYGRTGPLVWSIPHEANMALRHIGLLFFLAGLGVKAGGRFLEALQSSGWQLFLLGAITTLVSTAIALIMLRLYAKSSVISSLGATSGMQTQPATLARAHELCKAEEVYIAYATTYPVAMIGKILLAQLIFLFWRWF